jgi:hypothetical protein
MDNQRGATPIELALGLMLIVLPVTVLVLSIAPVFEHYNFARRAAAEAARTMVLATDAPEAAAISVVEGLALGFGVDPALVSVRFCGGGGCSLTRGSIASVDVSVRVEETSNLLPIGTLTVSATHAEQVDPFRSRP